MENSDEIPTELMIIAATNEILKDCDVSLMTLKSIKLKLEEKFQCPLLDCKTIIRQCLEEFMDKNQDDFLYDEKVQNEDADAPVPEPTKKRGGGGFNKPLELAPELAAFMGESHMARTEVTKRIWAYIKEHDLQNPSDKREIICDEALQKLFKRAKINMFKMTKALSPMMFSVKDIKDCQIASESEDDSEGSDEDSDGEEGSRGYKKKEKKAAVKKEVKKRKLEAATTVTTSSSSSGSSNTKRKATIDTKEKTKKVKTEKKAKSEGGEGDTSTPKKGGAFNKEHNVNPALAALINTGEQASRPQVVKNLWVYIKEHDLQNPADKREILMDKAMRAVFKVDKCTMFTINSLLSKQLYPIE